MEKVEIKEKISAVEEPPQIDGVLIESDDTDLDTVLSPRAFETRPSHSPNQRSYLLYFFLPFIFLTVTLLGGMRLGSPDNAFIFLKPALFCLIFGAILIVLFFRAGLIKLDGWFSEEFATLKNVANGSVLFTLFAASTQLFNSLLPEQGLPFWVVAFCFFWTLWNNLFAEFDTRKLLRSLGALFGLAFVVKYLVLANLSAPASESWLRSLIENPAKETFTWLLDLPRFSAGTGYIQFFAVAFYLIGLFLLPQRTKDSSDS
jgi:hypothetical protein